MKKLILITLITFSLSANNLTNCEQLAQVKIGDRFQTYNSKETISEIAKDEASKLKANKIVVDYTRVAHSKLGAQYNGTATLYKCANQ